VFILKFSRLSSARRLFAVAEVVAEIPLTVPEFIAKGAEAKRTRGVASVSALIFTPSQRLFALKFKYAGNAVPDPNCTLKYPFESGVTEKVSVQSRDPFEDGVSRGLPRVEEL